MSNKRRDNKNRILLSGEFQKPNGMYEYRYRDESNKLHSVYSWRLVETDKLPSGARKSRPLREIEKDIQSDALLGTDYYQNNKIAFDEAYRIYVENDPSIRMNTRKTYLSAYKRYAKKYIGNMKVADFKYSEAKKIYNRLLKDGCRFSTLNSVNSSIRHIINSMRKDDIFIPDTSRTAYYDIASMNGYKAKKRYSLTENQQREFLISLYKNKRYVKFVPIIIFALGTGCRLGELSALQWSDCDFVNNTISITKSINTNRRPYEVGPTKSPSGVRVIPMCSTVKKELLEFKKLNRKVEKPICGYSDFVFLNKNNVPLSSYSCNNAIRKVIDAYNNNTFGEKIPYITMHNLRHTFCTRLCASESNIKVIQAIMGHSDASVTMNIYADVFMDDKIKSINNVESVLFGT